ncbi:MAG: DNA-binding domain-containing protein, partial [Actinomycetota bacterium]|nr:DNA-binding domain-containing protein [Actinomycetota bacterium]
MSADRASGAPEAPEAPEAPVAPDQLRAMQRLLRALVTAPTGVGAALDGRPGVPGWLDDWADPVAALAGTVRGDDRLSAPARLDVYAQGYFARLHEVLEGDYPTVAWLCGEAAFNDLVTAFLVAHPSCSPTLRDLGGPFASFLTEHAVAAFARERWPGLADVARLEWAFADAFDAPAVPVLTRADLAGVDPALWADIPLEPVPGFALLCFDWPAGEAVSACRRGDPVPERRAERQVIAVWRAQERAVFRPVERLEAEALERVARGERFGGLCEWLADRGRGQSDGQGGAPGTAESEAAAVAAGWLAA